MPVRLPSAEIERAAALEISSTIQNRALETGVVLNVDPVNWNAFR